MSSREELEQWTKRTEAIEGAQVSIMECMPDSVIVLRYSRKLNAEGIKRIEAAMRKFFPGHAVAVLDDGAELVVQKTTQDGSKSCQVLQPYCAGE